MLGFPQSSYKDTSVPNALISWTKLQIYPCDQLGLHDYTYGGLGIYLVSETQQRNVFKNMLLSRLYEDQLNINNDTSQYLQLNCSL